MNGHPEANFSGVTAPAGSWQMGQIGQMLVKRGVITPAQLEQVLELQRTRGTGRPLGELLVEKGFLTRKKLTSVLAPALGVPFTVVMPSMVNPESLTRLPADFCDKHNVLPLSSVGGWLTVAIEDFENVHLQEQIKRISGQRVQFLAADGEEIREVRQRVRETHSLHVGSGDAGNALDQSDLEELTVLTVQKESSEQEGRDLEAAASGSPVIRLVNHIIKSAVTARASDIHIEPDDREVRIRYRIDGELSSESLRPPIGLLPALVSRIKIMAGMDISERRLPQDGGMAVMLSNRPIDLRISTMATPGGEKVVMRIIDNSAGIRKLDEIGLRPEILSPLRNVIGQPNGIVLVTGPTGSGKSTTLYAAMAELVSDKVNISSVEDPVEYHLRGINQFQVNTKAGFTFAKALRSLLRQDPDIIMVGEIRDAETARLATEAALTGHLVLTTLHTNDAPSAVPRLVNMGVEPYLVAASLRAVMAQRLVRRPCPNCRHEVPLRAGLKEALVEHYGSCPTEVSFEGAGCTRCRHTGFSGRTGIHELLVTDEEMLQALGHDITLQSIRQLARARGFKPMLHDCIEKLQSGDVAPEALFEVIGRVESDAEPIANAA